MNLFVQKVCGLKQRSSIWMLFIAGMILLFFGLRLTVSAKELFTFVPSIQMIEDSYEVPEEYHFSAQIQRDEQNHILTEFVPFGTWDNEQSHMAPINGEFVITKITGDAEKDAIGAWYYNVGTYKGKTVDLKCTIEDYMQRGGPDDTSGLNLGWVALAKDQLGIYVRRLQWVDLKMEFFDASTGEPLKIKSSAVITHIDEKEGMMILSEYDTLMKSKQCTLEAMDVDSKILFYESRGTMAFQEENDPWAQIQVLYEDSIFRYRVYSALGMEMILDKKEEEVSLSENALTADDMGAVNGPEPPEFMMHFQGYSDCRMAPLTVRSAEMFVSDSDEIMKEYCLLAHREEAFSYIMKYTVSPEHKNWYYDSFKVEGQLIDQIEYQSGAVYTVDGKDVSDQFYIRENDGLITFEAKQEKNRIFYGKTYLFTINVKINADAELETLWKEAYYLFPLKSKVEMIRGKTKIEKQMKQVLGRLFTEYAGGTVQVNLQDEQTGVILKDGEVALFEWSEKAGKYQEKERTVFHNEKESFGFSGLIKTYDNRGKYKVIVTKIPEHYEGAWEKEFCITRNQQIESLTGKLSPTGTVSVRMTSKILKRDTNGDIISEEYDSDKNPVTIHKGDWIQYHIYVERDSALGFKSGELILKNKIPTGLLYEKETLNLIGELIHPVENSTAKIASVRLNKEGELTWKIHYLDEGEIAHVLFEVKVPETIFVDQKETQDNQPFVTVFSDFAQLIDGEKSIQSNVLEHQVELSEVDIRGENKDESGTQEGQGGSDKKQNGGKDTVGGDKEINRGDTESLKDNPGGKHEAMDSNQVILPNEVYSQEMEKNSVSIDRNQSSKSYAVQTGDNSHIGFYVLSGSISMCLCFFFIKRYKQRSRKSEE